MQRYFIPDGVSLFKRRYTRLYSSKILLRRFCSSFRHKTIAEILQEKQKSPRPNRLESKTTALKYSNTIVFAITTTLFNYYGTYFNY